MGDALAVVAIIAGEVVMMLLAILLLYRDDHPSREHLKEDDELPRSFYNEDGSSYWTD